MATAVEVSSANRVRGTVKLPVFSFHREYVDYDRFLVSITDGIGTYQVEVRAWGNAMDIVRLFATSGTPRQTATKTLAAIYQTGYAAINGLNFRITPVA